MNRVLTSVFYTLLGVLLFASCIIFHEAGHLAMGFFLGLNVTEFSIGFGPLITQIHSLGLDWSLRLIPFGGYCWIEESLSTWPMFFTLGAGLLVNFVSAAVGFRMAEWRGEGAVDIGTMPPWTDRIPWYFGGGFIRFLLFPFHAMYRLGVEIQEGDLFRAWGDFHLLLGICNLLPFIPLVDGTKMFSILVNKLTGGSEDTVLLWLMFLPLVFVAALFLLVRWARANPATPFPVKVEMASRELEQRLSDLPGAEDFKWDISFEEGWAITLQSDDSVVRASGADTTTLPDLDYLEKIFRNGLAASRKFKKLA